MPYHVTQRGVDGRETFSCADDRHAYLGLLRLNLRDAGVRLLGWCLMTNHVHLIAVPARTDSLSILLRRVHGRYAQYYNARAERTGHLWQNRFFACALGPSHLWTALAYVERNPLRAGLVRRSEEYAWSSAPAHVAGGDGTGLLDMDWWRSARHTNWREILNAKVDPTADEPPEDNSAATLRACTYAGRPFGNETFVSEMSKRFNRQWGRRPSQIRAGTSDQKPSQFKLFDLVSFE
jgi:putative transposase